MTSQESPTSHSPDPERITQLQCGSCNLGLQTQFLQWATQSLKYQPGLLAYIQDEIDMLLGYA